MIGLSYNEILPGIYLGNYTTAKHLETLQSLGITHIMIATSDLDPWYPDIIQYKSVPEMDSEEDLTQAFIQACDFIRQAISVNGKVLVHW